MLFDTIKKHLSLFKLWKGLKKKEPKLARVTEEQIVLVWILKLPLWVVSTTSGAVFLLVHTCCYISVHLNKVTCGSAWEVKSQFAVGQCCDQKQHTGNLQCWPFSVAVLHVRAGKQHQDEPSPAAACTLSPADQPLLSADPRNQKPGQPSEDGSAPGRFKYNTLNSN